jgi:hypothetical protein
MFFLASIRFAPIFRSKDSLYTVTTDTPSVRECFLHSRTQKVADHLSERLIVLGLQVLRDVAQNVAFAAVILDKDRSKKQFFSAKVDRDFLADIPDTISIYLSSVLI